MYKTAARTIRRLLDADQRWYTRLKMTNFAATKTTKQEKVRSAKRAFILGIVDLSWKLAGAFLVPVLLGVTIDSVQDSNTYTYVGLGLGIILSILVIYQVVRNAEDYVDTADMLKDTDKDDMHV